MQVFTNLQFKLFWALSLFCYVLFIGEAGWGRTGNSHQDCINQIRAGEYCARLSTGNQCVFGIQTCNATYCKKYESQGYVYDENQPPNAKCVQKPKKNEQVVVSGKSMRKLCENEAGGTWTKRAKQVTDEETQELVEEDDSFCKCSDGSEQTIPDKGNVEKCGDKKKPADSIVQRCHSAGGKLDTMNNSQEEADWTCKCNGEFLDVMANSKAKCGASNDALAQKCKDKLGTWGGDEVDQNCYCNGIAMDLNEPTKCEATVAGPTEDDIDQILRECGLTQAADKLNKCGESSLKAAELCDKKAVESDKNNETAKGILNILGGVHQQKGVQTGNADVCGDVAKKSTLAFWALDAMKTTCEEKIASCKADCSPFAGTSTTWDSLARDCNARIDAKYGRVVAKQGAVRFDARRNLEIALKARRESSKPADKREVDPNMSSADMNSFINELKKYSSENLTKCEGDAPANKKDLLDYTSDVIKGAIGAAACKNALTANANRCAQPQMVAALNPVWCEYNRSEPCCAPFLTGALQCDGRDATHIHCICQKNQSDARCKTTDVAGGGNSQLGAPGSTANIAAPGGIKAGALSKPSNFSNDGFAVNEDPNANGKSPTAAGGSGGSPFAGTSGGGGGGAAPGAASGGGAGGDGKGGGGEGESQGLVGGAFSALKTLSDRVFGGGGSSAGKNGAGTGRAALDKNGKKKIDPEKWRPTGLRGVAGAGSELGPKNRDIWKQMNSQYATQYHTFLDGVSGK